MMPTPSGLCLPSVFDITQVLQMVQILQFLKPSWATEIKSEENKKLKINQEENYYPAQEIKLCVLS